MGGKVGDAFGVRRPFEVAFFLFCFSCLYTLLVIPYISPESLSDGKKDKKSTGGFLGPLKILAPQRIRLRDGTVKKHRGVLFLCMGVFLATVSPGSLLDDRFCVIWLTVHLARHRLRSAACPDVCNILLRLYASR